jgi:hypothetical protein
MTWNVVMGILSTLALFTPAVIIVVERLYRHRSFLALLAYYVMSFSYNLLSEHIIETPKPFIKTFGIVTNLFDIPLMLLFLLLFSASVKFSRRIKIITALFIAYEIAILFISGLTVSSVVYILGPGISIVFILSAIFFYQKLRLTIMYRKATGRALMIASVLFSYGCFGLIYLLYYVMKTPYVTHAFLLYFIVTIISSCLMSAGIFIEKKRIHKFSELKVTRKELFDFFNDTKKAASSGAALIKNGKR